MKILIIIFGLFLLAGCSSPQYVPSQAEIDLWNSESDYGGCSTDFCRDWPEGE